MTSLLLINTKVEVMGKKEDMDMLRKDQEILHSRSIMDMENSQDQNLLILERTISMTQEDLRMLILAPT